MKIVKTFQKFLASNKAPALTEDLQSWQKWICQSQKQIRHRSKWNPTHNKCQLKFHCWQNELFHMEGNFRICNSGGTFVCRMLQWQQQHSLHSQRTTGPKVLCLACFCQTDSKNFLCCIAYSLFTLSRNMQQMYQQLHRQFSGSDCMEWSDT